MDICDNMRNGYSQIEDDMILCFFKVFSRLEYALKETGYFNGSEDYISVDWNKFFMEYENKYSNVLVDFDINEQKFDDLKKQVVVDGEMVWKNIESNEDESKLKYHKNAISVIRNNFFHGGKASSYGGFSNRDTSLIEESLKIIKIIVELDRNVKDYFYDE